MFLTFDACGNPTQGNENSKVNRMKSLKFNQTSRTKQQRIISRLNAQNSKQISLLTQHNGMVGSWSNFHFEFTIEV